MIALFAISLQCALTSSILSGLHAIEHVAEHGHDHPSGIEPSHLHHSDLGDHHPGHGHGWAGGDHHPMHGQLPAAEPVADPDHMSDGHGFFHAAGGGTLSDHVATPFGLASMLRGDPPQGVLVLGRPRPGPVVLLRPPIA